MREGCTGVALITRRGGGYVSSVGFYGCGWRSALSCYGLFYHTVNDGTPILLKTEACRHVPSFARQLKKGKPSARDEG